MGSAGRLRTTQAQLAGCVRGVVLEIGAGEGANFDWFAPTVDWIGLEPDRRTASRLRANALRHGHRHDVLVAGCEAIPLPDESVDAVLSTRALCSVADQPTALAEIARVLRQDGSLVFLEHVVAPPGSAVRLIQRAAAPLTKRFDHGCDPTRDTVTRVRESGFEVIDLTDRTILGIPVVAGRARRPTR